MPVMTSPQLSASAADTPSAAPSSDADADAARWQAVVQRDGRADGQFWYSVRSTGVYCKPSCGARTPLRKNVAFHASCAAAEAAGFRPCKRCKPDQAALQQRHAEAVAQACRLIDSAATAPDTAALAEAVGLSHHHFHRLFKVHTGMTPKAYVQARRAERMRAQLPGSRSVTEAMYASGFSSSGRFYADSLAQLGMKPTAYRRGGAGEQIRFAVARCWLGAVLVAATVAGICAVALGEDADLLIGQLQDRFPQADLGPGDADFEHLVAQVLAALDDPRQGAGLPLDLRGTAFQQRVWQALRSLPAGQTLSYAELAARLGQPGAARAVASACARNEIAVLIPCHRIVRLDGSPSGYRWGVARKDALLAREAGISEVGISEGAAADGQGG